MLGLIGRKIGMTRIFDDSGVVIPTTVIEAGPCFVSQRKTKENDRYEAIQLGFGTKKEKLVTKPLLGHLKKTNCPPLRILKEFKSVSPENLQPGQEVKVDVFKPGEYVKVTGFSKGRGFAGGVKRHGFSGGPKSHGQTNKYRAPGSIGSTTSPGRVWKGKRMAGHFGGEKITVRNLKVVKVDKERNLLLVKGAIPGANKSFVTIEKI
ncbi:MAG: 50S ribosomal protein L3 [Candidatus Edwardsbacteria bacterium]